MTAPSPVPGSKPTNARRNVLALGVSLALIQMIDRVCISQAQGQIRRDLNLSSSEMGWVFSAFTIAYALFEIPTGLMGDRIGARRVIMRVVLWWSAFTALTGAAFNYASMVVTRFLFGIGEAGCFPNLTRAFAVWMTPAEKSRAQGVVWMAARWGGAFTPLLVAAVLQVLPWRWTFVAFGMLGVLWSVWWFRWFRDDPREHPSVNAAEAKLLEVNRGLAAGHHQMPWGKLAGSGRVWLLWLQYACLSYSWYFYITWLPRYLKEFLKVSDQLQPVLATLPLFFGGIGCLLCGLYLPKLAARYGVDRTRRLVPCAGFLLAALMIVVSVNTQGPILAMIFMGLASFFNDLVMPPAWNTCMDVGGKHAGTMAGSMNMMGNLGGAVGPVVAGYMLQNGGGWELPLYSMAAAYLLGALCWPFIDTVTPLEKA